MNGKEPGDAEIVEISPEGMKSFSKGFDEPKGMAFVDNYLYFSDLKRVWKVDANGNASVFVDSTKFPNPVSYLNDVSSNADGTGIFVVDMGANTKMKDPDGNLWPIDSEGAKLIERIGRVYHIDLSGQVTLVEDASEMMINPNGVGIDNNGNYMVGAFFTGNFLVNRDGVLTPLKGQFRGADAVEQDSKGNYYVSSWIQGKAWKIDGKTEESTVLIDGLKSAADFYLEEEKGRLLLPDMLAGMVYSVDINK
ncbi:MAG: gluconolaconase [Cyclobacteriaceae bacterium]